MRRGLAASRPACEEAGNSKGGVPPSSWSQWRNEARGLGGVASEGLKHMPRIQPLRSELRKGAKSAVPLADRAIGNLQQWLIGTYHGVSRAQLQVYLDEFVFRHNRRNQPMAAFQTLLGLGTAHGPTAGSVIRGGHDLPQFPIRS